MFNTVNKLTTNNLSLSLCVEYFAFSVDLLLSTRHIRLSQVVVWSKNKVLFHFFLFTQELTSSCSSSHNIKHCLCAVE
jgi:hypothetical protein